ncbi:MAG TPA: DNA-processing protein DprA [Streptosporangiaceae bacterium]|nr:DNA-processing protein DprA [Streptosporangiaceae bacterium]
MSEVSGEDRLARAALTCVAEPGDPVMGALLRSCSPAEIVTALVQRRAPAPAMPAGGTGPGRRGPHALERALGRWADRLGEAPAEPALDAWRREGVRLVCPGDPEWPGQLDALGDARPWGLWVRGSGDLRYACLRSVSIVGTRSASAYGSYVCTEMAAALAERGWTVISGGAFGIDGCAHRGAVTADGVTVAVLACGVDRDYPQGHHGLFRAMRTKGATVSEWPPGRMPTRPGFLVRNRVIAALSRGTVVVEAALRSGALNTARHARDQNRPLMAVPGPVTSALSAGCHEIIRDWGAVCVTGAQDVIEVLSFPDDEAPGRARGPVLPRDELDPVMRQVLEAVPARAGRGPARIAVAAGVGFDTVMRCLGALAAAGFVERCERGWRMRRVPAGHDRA